MLDFPSPVVDDQIFIAPNGVTYKYQTPPDIWVVASQTDVEAATDVVLPETFGVFGNPKDATSYVDETAAITNMITSASANKQTILWDDRLYAFNKVWLDTNDTFARWRSRGTTILHSTKTVVDTINPPFNGWEADAFVMFSSNMKRQVLQPTTVEAGEDRLTIDDTSDILVNDYVFDIRSTRMIETDNRGQSRHGWTVPVSRIVDGTTVEMARPAPVKVEIGDITGLTVTAVTASSVTVTGLPLTITRNAIHYQVNFTTVHGVATTLTRYPDKVDIGPDSGGFGTATFFFNASTLPAAPGDVQVGDTLDVIRQLYINITYSSKVDIEGFVFQRAPHTGVVPDPGNPDPALETPYGYRGLRVLFALKPRIHNVQFRNFSETGLTISTSYAPRVSEIKTENCNRYWGLTADTGTGYGVACHQSSWGVFKDIQGIACRRVLDFGGSQGAAYHNIAENIQGYGAGATYTATAPRFWPNGVIEQTVVGSHGGAWYTQYINCRGFNVWGIVNLRGYDESIHGLYGAGRIQYMIHSFLGDGVVADGIHYTNGQADWVTDADDLWGYGAGPIGKRWLGSALAIRADNIIPTKPHMVSNVTLRGVDTAVIEVLNAGQCGPIFLSGAINVMTANFAGNTDFYMIRPTGGSPKTMLGPVVIGPANIMNLPTLVAGGSFPVSPKTNIYSLNVNTAGFAWAQDAYVRTPEGMYVFKLAPASVMRIPVKTFPYWALISVHETLTSSPADALIDGYFYSNNATNFATVPNMSAGYATSNLVLDGSNGVAAKTTIAYRPAGGIVALYIANQTATEKIYTVRCDTGL